MDFRVFARWELDHLIANRKSFDRCSVQSPLFPRQAWRDRALQGINNFAVHDECGTDYPCEMSEFIAALMNFHSFTIKGHSQQ